MACVWCYANKRLYLCNLYKYILVEYDEAIFYDNSTERLSRVWAGQL